jgi:hypothetical protein
MWEVLQDKSDLQDNYLVLEGYNLAVDSSNLLWASFVAVGARAHIGKTPQIASRSSWAQVYVGASKSRWGALPLPFDLGPFGAPGCGIWVSLDAALPTYSDLATGAISVLDVPDDPRWLGRSIFLQAVTFNAYFNKLNLGTSQGLEVIPGPKPAVEATSVSGPWNRWGIEFEFGWISVWASSVFELGY